MRWEGGREGGVGHYASLQIEKSIASSFLGSYILRNIITEAFANKASIVCPPGWKQISPFAGALIRCLAVGRWRGS